MRRNLETSSTFFSWRQIRHGRNHRRPQTHTEERAERDDLTYEPMSQDDRELLEMTAEELQEVKP